MSDTRRTNPDKVEIKAPRPADPPVPGYPRGRLPSRPEVELKAPVAIRPQRVVQVAREAPPESGPAAAQAPRPDPEPPSVAPQVDQAIGRATRALGRAVVDKLWPILVAGVLGTGGAVAYQRSTDPPERADRQTDQLRDLQRDLAETRTELAKTQGELRALRTWAVEDQAWRLSLEATRGVRIRPPEGSAPLPAIETTRPIRSRPPPAVTVQSPPPSVPAP